ncbi:MAG: DNA polymerase IV [Clostridia bacterium]|nr:DNA polymerase IV [Clostridia bacterium]
MNRTILHCDMNNFYASVECHLNPALAPHPIAVCGETEERHGIVLAKNYLAKDYGVRTGEAVWQAKQKCPSLLIVPPHYEEYVKVSRAARQIYYDYTDTIEPMGLDECWLDVTGSRRFFGEGETLAHTIRTRIKSELGVTVSIGVSFNKVFAKLGSDLKKPDAVTVITAEDFRARIWNLPASEMLGVGSATAKKLHAVGIHTIGDLAHYPRDCLRYKLGKCGDDLWRYANGLDTSAVVTREIEDLDKTAGHGITTREDLVSDDEVWRVMLSLAQNVGHRLHVYQKKATGVAIDVRDNALFSRIWQCKLAYPTQSAFRIADTCFSLFQKSYGWARPIRSLTVRAIGLVAENLPYQFDLFHNADSIEKEETLDRTIEQLRERYGSSIIRNAVLLHNPKMPRSDVLLRHTATK